MAKEHSFDISAKLEMMELKNALQQAEKEVENRFDFKGSTKEYTLDEKAKTVTILSSSDSKADAMIDVLVSKMIKREISPNGVKELSREDASGGNRRVVMGINDTLKQEDAKKIVAEIKKSGIKVQASIQGEEIRVKGKSLDELQAVQQLIRGMELEAPIGFGNYR